MLEAVRLNHITRAPELGRVEAGVGVLSAGGTTLAGFRCSASSS